MSAPRIVFAGTPAFALASLKALCAAKLTPVAVYTQPDRRAGRGRRMSLSPVKRFALDNGLTVLQPSSLKPEASLSSLTELRPDVMLVAAYGLLLPQAVLDLPRHGCINVHASLLPRWRGAAPIQAAILAGDRQTGISLMQMDAGLDTGPVFSREAVDIGPEATAGELHDQLAELGGAMLAAQLPAILEGRLSPQAQDDSRATYAPKIRSADARLDWSLPAERLHRSVRAYNPVPGARFDCEDETVKCWTAELGGDLDAAPGTVVAASAAGVDVACGMGSLRLTRVQRPGRKPVTAAEFAAQLDLVGRTFS